MIMLVMASFRFNQFLWICLKLTNLWSPARTPNFRMWSTCIYIIFALMWRKTKAEQVMVKMLVVVVFENWDLRTLGALRQIGRGSLLWTKLVTNRDKLLLQQNKMSPLEFTIYIDAHLQRCFSFIWQQLSWTLKDWRQEYWVTHKYSFFAVFFNHSRRVSLFKKLLPTNKLDFSDGSIVN